MALRLFTVRGRSYRLVEGPDVRRRDIRNRTITVQDPADEKVYCFYQAHEIGPRIGHLPLSVRIYTTARQVLEAMLRSAISDADVETAFDFRSGAPATAERPAEPMRLAALQRPPDPTAGEDTICRYRFEGQILVVSILSKEFKLAEARRYAELVFDRLKARVAGLVVELGNVTYMNSSGISVLARSAATFPLKIANVSTHVRTVMEMMGLVTVIELYDDVASALAAFQAKPPPAKAPAVGPAKP